MGTRGFVGFVVDGIEKILVRHGSSYPSEAGCEVLDWLTRNRDALRHPVPGGAPDQVRALRILREGTEPAPAEVERIRDLLCGRPEYRDDPDFIAGADPEELLEFVTYDLDTLLLAGVAEDGSGFPVDSLYCEWGYLIDLDAAVFEVYRGFQRASHGAGRFARRPPAQDGYHPVALVASWPLAALPDRADFLGLPGAY